jgi:hypothetical protein
MNRYLTDDFRVVIETAQGTATPRVAHRLASDGKNVLVIGGADKGRNSDFIEAGATGK